MMYRYGDATPFPLDDNFIDTLVAATEAAVGLFQADGVAEERRRRVMEIRKLAEEELKRLNVLGRAVNASIQPMLPDGKAERTSEATAAKIQGATRSAIKAAVAGVERRRDAAIRAALGRALSDQMYDALAPLLLTQQLPKTRWTVRWMYDNERAASQIVIQSANVSADLNADYSCELPPHHSWRGAVKVGSLTPHLEIQMLTEGKRKKSRAHSLARYFVTEAELSPHRSSFVLRKSYKKPSPGFMVVMREEDQALPRITRIEPDGSPRGASLTIAGDSQVALGALWDKIEHAMHEMRRHRDAVQAATFEGNAIERNDEPAAIAESILDTLAPFIREMRLRSRVPGELILKRDRGDGRREELFVPRAELEARFAELPDRHRRYFEAVGLSSEATTEFVGREFPLAAAETPPPMARSRRGTPPPPPRKQTMSSLPDLPSPPPELIDPPIDTVTLPAAAPLAKLALAKAPSPPPFKAGAGKAADVAEPSAELLDAIDSMEPEITIERPPAGKVSRIDTDAVTALA